MLLNYMQARRIEKREVLTNSRIKFTIIKRVKKSTFVMIIFLAKIFFALYTKILAQENDFINVNVWKPSRRSSGRRSKLLTRRLQGCKPRVG